MRKLILAIVLLLMASVCSSSFFQRPWENSTWIARNPNIWSYGVEYWWNIPELDDTISSLEAEPLGELAMNGSSASYAEQSAEARLQSRKDKDTCIYAVVTSIGYFPATPVAIFVSAFAEGFGCVSYKKDWTGAVGSALSALEASMAESKKSIEDARVAYDRLVFIGVCGSDYSGPGSEICAELQSAFMSIDNNVTEGEYGRYHLLVGYARELKQDLNKPVPDLSLYGTMMRLAWDEGGVISQFHSAASMARKAEADADSEYKSVLVSAQNRKALADKALSGLEADDLDLIDHMPSGFDVRSTGSVKEKLSGLQAEAASLAQTLAEASAWHSRTARQGYMAMALGGAGQADEGYSELIRKASDLRTEAEDAVEQQKQEAEQELGETGRFLQSGDAGPDAEGMLAEARGFFSDAESASSLGSAFVAYSRAAALARSAREGTQYAEALGSASALADLKDFIARAEKDGINVAEEKEVLSLMEDLPQYQAEEHAREAMDSIISKARVMYEDDLLAARARIYDKLSLAGPDAADLLTDMSRCEEGLASDQGLELPKAIGSMKTLSTAYAKIEAALDQYMAIIVGNSMSVSADALVIDVRLDEPADIILDTVLSNDRPYSATGVEARISMPAPMPFLYSDITSGKDGVSSLRMEDGDRTVVLIFQEIQAFDSKRVILEKNVVLAHTIQRESVAEGIGNGAALVSEVISFELDSDIQSFTPPEGTEEGLIDGLPQPRALPTGRHKLTAGYVVQGAYSESISNIRTYPLGPSTRVEYDIRITPGMDLSKVPMLLDAINDSRISAFDVVSVTGEAVKDKARVSETQFGVTIYGLRKSSTAVLKAGYTVEDTGPFVESQIEQLQSANLSAGARELLEQARIQADAGNYSKALELLEKSKAVMKQDEQEAAKLQARCEEMLSRITSELDEINVVIASGGADSAFMERMTARKAELERVLEDAGSANLSDKAVILAAVDYGWLAKELNVFKKQAYSEYNDLKSRFFNAGNSSTPDAFLVFESDLHKLESGARLEYAAVVSNSLAEVRVIVAAQEKVAGAQKAELKALLDSMESDFNDILGRYSKQASAAKGTDYSGMFTESEKQASKLLADAKSALSADPRLAWSKLRELNSSMARMELILGTLKNESETKLSILERLLAGSKMAESAKDKFREEIDGVRGFISQGEYVNALRTGSTIGVEMENSGKADDSGMVVLGLSAIAVLAGISFYIMKQEPKKELRKIPSARDFIRSLDEDKPAPDSQKPKPVSAPPKAAEP